MKGLLFALALSFGLTALYGVAVSDEPGKPSESAGGAAKVADGKPVFTKYKCRSCHAIEAQGITKKASAEEAEESGFKAPDLSGVGVERKADWIAAFLMKKEKLDGKLHVKKFRGTDAELQKLAAWLATLKDEAAAKKMKEKPEAKSDK